MSAELQTIEALVAEDPQPFLIGAIAEPRGQQAPRFGVIVIGMGMADLQVARRFAKLGCVAMQIRLIKDHAHHQDEPRRHATYDTTGVSRCRRAMDYLAAKYRVRQFILMGNCALANISFNTALADTRVVGLVLTNPFVPESAMGLSLRMRRHLFNAQSWIRLLTGRMRPRDLPRPPISPRLADGSPAASRSKFTQDVMLPSDYPQRLEQLLTVRGVRTLLVFSKGEASLYYFRRYFGRVLDRLARGGNLQFEVTDIPTHDFSARDDAVARLNEIVSTWARKTWN